MTKTVTLQYFKRGSGKWYAQGELPNATFNDIYALASQVRQMKSELRLPGLIRGHDDFVVLIEAPNCPPHLVL